MTKSKFKKRNSPAADDFKFGIGITVLAIVIIIVFSQKEMGFRDGSHDGCYGFPQTSTKKLTS